jgi:hypothetical protein
MRLKIGGAFLEGAPLFLSLLERNFQLGLLQALGIPRIPDANRLARDGRDLLGVRGLHDAHAARRPPSRASPARAPAAGGTGRARCLPRPERGRRGRDSLPAPPSGAGTATAWARPRARRSGLAPERQRSLAPGARQRRVAGTNSEESSCSGLLQ